MSIGVEPEDRFKLLAQRFFRERRDLYGQGKLTFHTMRDPGETALRLAVKHEQGATATYTLSEDMIHQDEFFMYALKAIHNELLELLTDPVNNPTL